MKRRTLLLKVPKEAMSGKKRRRGVSELHCDYLKRQNRPANRRRTDPVVVLSTILENILNEMRDMPDVSPFLFPVNPKVSGIDSFFYIIQIICFIAVGYGLSSYYSTSNGLTNNT